MRAINDRVIIKTAFMPESVGGIVLAQETIDHGQLKLNVGKVLSAGPGVTLRTGEQIPVHVKTGDVVCWEQFGALPFEILGKNIVCVRSEDIGCILDEVEYKGKYLFDDAEIDEYNKRIEREREELSQKLASAPMLAPPKITFQCWNNDCKAKLKDVVTTAESPICEFCGKLLTEKQFGPISNVHGGTPRFHDK